MRDKGNASRIAIDRMLRELWLAYSSSVDELGSDFITEADSDVWAHITEHPAIQDKIKKQ